MAQGRQKNHPGLQMSAITRIAQRNGRVALKNFKNDVGWLPFEPQCDQDGAVVVRRKVLQQAAQGGNTTHPCGYHHDAVCLTHWLGS